MLTGATNEEKIWNYLKAQEFNDYGAAGLMGNIYAESGFNPENLQNDYEKKLNYTDSSYTEAVDNGTYTNFAHDGAGYGLCQWTYWSRKQALSEYAKSRNRSVGDMETQLDFMLRELSEYNISALLKTAESVLYASNLVLLKFEQPGDMNSLATQTRRAGYGQTYYDRYAVKEMVSAVTENELRQKVVNIAVGFVGCKESDGSHRKIIDTYNSHSPLASGYKVQYTDAWCATFVSAVFITAGLTDIAPTECSCGRMIELYRKLGRWQESDAYIPSPGDVLMYDWDDSGTGDCTGAPDHVGIVVSVSGSAVKVIEGNKSDAVGYRTMQVNGRYIRGYCLPDYGSKATVSGGVHTVVKGDTLSAIALKYGSTVSKIVAANIGKYSKLTASYIEVGWGLTIP